MRKAVELVEKGRLVLFGITPGRTHTGYGYVEIGAQLNAGNVVAGFHEKPDIETAASYLRSGRYLWNSEIFLFSVGATLTEYEKHCPEMLEQCPRGDSHR